MKLNVDVNEVVISNSGQSGEFKIRNSAKAFKILSNSLYSNKIRAIIRELSCNALDSHVAAGRQDVPFEVHLPTMLEPWFSVKDYGIGLDHDQITNIYTTYFESTKTESNEFIGALGLGSKSPFSYTENFTVAAVKDGISRIYSAYINDQGVPAITLMIEEDTDQPNGVEVKFSVTSSNDFWSFKSEAQSVFEWFEAPPKLTGAAIHITPKEYVRRNIVPGVHLTADLSSYYRSSSIALMGNIPYPLDNIPESAKLGDLQHLLSCGLVLEFEIGELDFAPSREQLSYVPITVESIRRKLQLLQDNLYSSFEEEVDKIENIWEKIHFLEKRSRSRLYSQCVKSWSKKNSDFTLFSPDNHCSRLHFTEVDLDKMSISLEAFRTGSSSTSLSKISPEKIYNNGKYDIRWNIIVDPSTVFVFDDLKIGAISRIRHSYANLPSGVYVYLVRYTGDIEDRAAAFEQFKAKLYYPPKMVSSSSLEKPEPVRRLTTNDVMVVSHNFSRRRISNYIWEKAESDDLTGDGPFYYVPLSGFKNLDPKITIGVIELKSKMAATGVDTIRNIKIYGVRKSALDTVSKDKRWVLLSEHLTKEMAAYNQQYFENMLRKEIVDFGDNLGYYNNEVAGRYTDKTSEYYKYFQKYRNCSKQVKGVLGELLDLARMFGQDANLTDLRTRLQTEKEAFLKRYPFARLFRHYDFSEEVIFNYINMVDKQEKNQ